MALLTIQRSSSAGSTAPPPPLPQQQPHTKPDTNSNSGSSAGTDSTTTSADASSITTSELAGLAEEEAVALRRTQNESYFAGRGQARILGGGTVNDQFLTSIEGQPLSSIRGGTNLNIANTGCDIQQHLQSMFYLLRKEETLKMAVKLETARTGRTRYLVVVSRPGSCHHSNSPTSPLNNAQGSRPDRYKSNILSRAKPTAVHSTTDKQNRNNQGGQSLKHCDKLSDMIPTLTPVRTSGQSVRDDQQFCESSHTCNEAEESCLLGIDCNEKTTVGLVLRIQADTTIRLDGDGGFSISVNGRTHIFKPVSVQSMWSALQTLHKVSKKARKNNYYPGGPSHEWASYYENRIESERSCLNEWHAMDSLESRRPPSPDAMRNKPTEREETEQVIKTALKEVMMSVDLDEVTSKYIRTRLEEHLDMDLGEFKSFLDEEMLIILGKMDAPTKIFDHVYLGSEWNASNLEELQKNGVGHILNVTREIDNFFPGMFDYLNVRVYDDEKTNLLKHWDNTFKYITRAGKVGSKVLVHCKMGVSRSASVVIAYAMKAYCLNFETALEHVKQQRTCIKPNKSFLQQLETYQGMLDAMKNKEKLQRSKSDTNLRTSSTKDGRLLPGSEPTPLIQALNSSAANPSNAASSAVLGRDSVDSSRMQHIARPLVRRSTVLSHGQKCGRRPSSWSPEHVEASVPLSKQQSQSLENLAPERKEEKTKNVLLPCSNGQNYSVSQNQVVHLQENVPSVKLIVSELESNKERNQLARRSRRTIGGSGEMASITTTLDVAAALAASTASLNQSNTPKLPASQLPPQQINQLESKSQTNIKAFNLNHHHHNQLNNNPLCDSPAWTTCPSPLASTSSSSCSTTISTNTPTTATANILTSTSMSHLSTTNHHKPTEIHLCLSQSTISTPPSSSSPSNVPRRRDIILPDSTSSQPPHPASKRITLRHSSGETDEQATNLSAAVSPRPYHRDMPSRHASWGSADTSRTLPSRNCSLGSFDLRPSETSILARNVALDRKSTSSVFPYDRDEIPWHPGTVKRTKQKIESSSVVKRKCGNQQDSATDTGLGKPNVFNFTDQNVPPSHRYKDVITTPRSQSEEILPAETTNKILENQNSACQRLSASAPESSTIECLATKKRNQSRMGRTMFPQRSLDGEVATIDPKDECFSNVFASATNTYGIVQNLKQNFETCRQDAKKKVKSLPSSPIAAHPDKTGQCDRPFTKFGENMQDHREGSQEERNVRGLVDRYEVHRSGSAYAVKPRPRSEYITNSSFSSSKPHMISHATIFNKADDFRRPPVPPPTVRNTLGSSSIFSSSVNPTPNAATMVVSSSLVSGSNTLSYRKMQQHGKTHPLSRLSLNNPLLNTATYNTM